MKLLTKSLLALSLAIGGITALGVGVVANADELLDMYAYHSTDFQHNAQKAIATLGEKGYDVGEIDLDHRFGKAVLDVEAYKGNMAYDITLSYPSLTVLSELPDGRIYADDDWHYAPVDNAPIHHAPTDTAVANTPHQTTTSQTNLSQTTEPMVSESPNASDTTQTPSDFATLRQNATTLLSQKGYQTLDIDLENNQTILDIDATKDGLAYDIKMNYPELTIISETPDNT